MQNLTTRFSVLATALLVTGGFNGCTVEDPIPGAIGGAGGGTRPASPGDAGPDGTGGGGGNAAGADGRPAGTGGGPAGTGGAPGGSSGTGGTPGGGSVGPPARDASTAPPAPDAPRATPDTSPPPPPPVDASPADGPIVVRGPGGLGLCSPDPLVVATCRQLEPACQNCPPGGAPDVNPIAGECFALTARAFMGNATDADCVKFFTDNNCKVDDGGNVCGSLNCAATGCNQDACETAWGGGSSETCEPLLATCPCR